MSAIEAARAQLREIARDLEAIRYRLMGVHASVPPPASEMDPLGEVDSTDPAAEIRGYIEAILSDSIGPTIRDLLDVASPKPKTEGEKA